MGEKLSVNTPDEKLIHEFVNRSNINAFGFIYEKYVADVHRIVYLRVGRQSFIEDIVSDTFMTLMKVLPNYRGESKLKTFIIGIAINKVRQHWQKSENDPLTLREEIVIIDPDEEIDEEMNEQSIEQAKLDTLEILGKLESPYKEVLKSRFIEGKSIRETAKILNLSEANVRVIQHRALKKAAPIAEQLKENGKRN